MISIKDIREKEFSRQVKGYNTDEVEDFLDELADQTEALVRENLKMSQELKALREAAAQPQAVPAPLAQSEIVPAEPEGTAKEESLTAINEPQYFKNLELTLRDTLISAQKIADETVAEARKKANQLIASAEEKAAAIHSAAKVEAEALRNETEEMKKAAADYRARFLRLVEDQVHILKADDSLYQDGEKK